jgi:tetratricopeptide (TPR) repeat protein
VSLGEALAGAVPQALVGGSIAPARVASVSPIVEATWEALREKTPAPESDEDLDLGRAASAFAHLRLWQRRRDPLVEERIAAHYVALAFEGPERAIEMIDRTSEPWAEILAVRARLLHRLGRDAEALATWDAAIRAPPRHADWPRYKAMLQLRLGGRGGAEATIRAMVEARRDREEAAELVIEFAEALEGEDAARFRALAASLVPR